MTNNKLNKEISAQQELKVGFFFCYTIKAEITNDYLQNTCNSNLREKNTKKSLGHQIHWWAKRVTYCHPLLGPLNTEQVGHGPNHAAPATHQKQNSSLKMVHLSRL